MILETGNATGYGLGVSISAPGGRRRISHGGAVSGYTTSKQIYPDDRAAIVVFTNIYPGAAGAPGQIAGRIAKIIFAPADTASAAAQEPARRIYDGLAKGTIDRALLTAARTPTSRRRCWRITPRASAPLGTPTELRQPGNRCEGA